MRRSMSQLVALTAAFVSLFAGQVHAWTANSYTVQNPWGGSRAPWNPGGTWVIGGRNGQAVVALDVKSTDKGQSLNGTMAYNGEGPIGFKGARAP